MSWARWKCLSVFPAGEKCPVSDYTPTAACWRRGKAWRAGPSPASGRGVNSEEGRHEACPYRRGNSCGCPAFALLPSPACGRGAGGAGLPNSTTAHRGRGSAISSAAPGLASLRPQGNDRIDPARLAGGEPGGEEGDQAEEEGDADEDERVPVVHSEEECLQEARQAEGGGDADEDAGQRQAHPLEHHHALHLADILVGVAAEIGRAQV